MYQILANLCISSHKRLLMAGFSIVVAVQVLMLGYNRGINPLVPSDPYMGRTAQLTSRHCILNTCSTNIHTEYFKRAA
jgi:hypothetical protein